MQSLIARLRAFRLPAVQLAFLERPRNMRDAVTRAAVFAVVIAAAVTPVFLGRSATDACATMSDEFVGHIEREDESTRVGGLAPDFRLRDTDCEPFQLSEVEGPVILNFWASWCAPCIEEMPDFQLVHEEFGDRLTLIGINDGEDQETAIEFQGRTGVEYLILLDPTTQLTRGPYGLIGRPTTFYIRADGIIHDVRVGIHSLEEMQRLARELVGDEPSAAAAPVPSGYTESALDLIASGRANFNVGQDLLADWAQTPTLFDDPGWRRNIIAQADTWDALVDLADGLAAPASVRAMHDELSASLRSIQVSGSLLREAVELSDAAEVEAAQQLLAAAAEEFRNVANDLERALR